MPNPDKIFAKDYEQNFNPLLIFMLLVVVIINVWLMFKGIFEGVVFFGLFTASIISLVIVYQFSKGDPQYSDFAKIVRAPFSTSLYVGSFMFVAGFTIRMAIYLIEKILKYSFVGNFTIPLSVGKIDQGITQSFAVAQAKASMPLILFNRQFNAGTTEEFVFGFALVFVVALMLFSVSKFTKPDSFWRKKYFILITSILVSTLLFMGAHTLNESYTESITFLIAGIFRLVSLISIYIWGVFLSFWVGFHQSNNLLDAINEFGIVQVAEGFLSWYGLLFVGLFALLTWYLISRWNVNGKTELKNYWSK